MISFLNLAHNIQLPTSVAAQYKGPSASVTVITHAIFCNTSGSAIAITAYIVPSGQSVADAAKVIDAFSIAQHSSYVSPELAGIVLNTGDTLQCFASAASVVSLNVSGIKQT